MDNPFNLDHSFIIAKASVSSTQSLRSIKSIANILFNEEFYCEDFYQKALELISNLKEQHSNPPCGKCKLASSRVQSRNLDSSYNNRMDLLGQSDFSKISESRKYYPDLGPGEAPQEGDQLDFKFQYRGTLENAIVSVENLGFKNYEMNFSFEKEKEGFGLKWRQIVSKREHAEEICKQVQSLESLKLDCISEIENWRKLVEEMEGKVFYNNLEKSIEIKAEKDMINDDGIKGILSSLSDKKNNFYLSLDLSDNPEITNDIIPRLYDCLKNWQSKGFSYLLLKLNNTSVNLDFIDTLCERMPVSLKGLWLEVIHLTIDEKRNTRLLNFLKAHHSYMEFFVIKIGCDKEKEEENQRRIHNIYRIKDRLKLFSVIGSVISDRFEEKVMRSFSNFGGGKLEIEFKNPNLKSRNISGFNVCVPTDSIEMRKRHSGDNAPQTHSNEFATTNTGTQGLEEKDSFPALNTFHDQSSVEKSLDPNFASQEIKILSESDQTEPPTKLSSQSVQENLIQDLNETKYQQSIDNSADFNFGG